VLYAVGYPLGADGADRAGLGHGVVMGMVNLAWGSGAVAGPIAGSGLATWTGGNAAYLVLGCLALASGIAVRMMRRVGEGAAKGPAKPGPNRYPEGQTSIPCEERSS
jgi:MFS family permease